MNSVKDWKEIKHFGQVFNFLMFEIVLALFVVKFGIFGVSSMFPVGLNLQREAVGASYITDVTEQLLRLNASYIKMIGIGYTYLGTPSMAQTIKGADGIPLRYSR